MQVIVDCNRRGAVCLEESMLGDPVMAPPAAKAALQIDSIDCLHIQCCQDVVYSRFIIE